MTAWSPTQTSVEQYASVERAQKLPFKRRKHDSQKRSLLVEKIAALDDCHSY